MGKKDLKYAISGMLFSLAANVVGWALAFAVGTEKQPIRLGWDNGLLSNIPLGILIIVCMLIYVFDNEWAD